MSPQSLSRIGNAHCLVRQIRVNPVKGPFAVSTAAIVSLNDQTGTAPGWLLSLGKGRPSTVEEVVRLLPSFCKSPIVVPIFEQRLRQLRQIEGQLVNPRLYWRLANCTCMRIAFVARIKEEV
jgi:hypothetical protein